MPQKTKGFDKLLIEAIDEALSSLGKSVKQAIYFHIENNFVVRSKIPENIKDFQVGLERIFGAGAPFLEILIMKKIHEKMGITITMEAESQLEFASYVKAAKESFLRKKS